MGISQFCLLNAPTNVFAKSLWNNLFVYCDYVSLTFRFHKTEKPKMVEFGGRKNAGKKKFRIGRRYQNAKQTALTATR